MPYYISNDNPGCNGWAVEKDNGEVVGCHRTRRDAIDQMVAVSLAEGLEPGGERNAKAGSAGDVTESMRDEAQQGLDWREEYGRGGTAVGAGTARRIVANDVSLELAVKMRAYFARHEVDQEAPGWNRGEDGYPSAGLIAWKLWGGDSGREWAERVVAEYRETEEDKNGAHVVLVVGPPAAGKSTYVQTHAKPGDLVVEWERLATAIDPEAGRSQKEPLRSIVGAARTALYTALGEAAAEQDVRAWVIAGAPGVAERKALADEVGASRVVVVLCSQDEAAARIEKDESRAAAAEEHRRAVERWWRKYEPHGADEVVYTGAVEAKAQPGTGQRMNIKRHVVAATWSMKSANDANGEVEALVSVFNNKDLVGDRVLPGAFAESLALYAESGKSIPWVWSHQWDNPDAYIGKVTEARETQDGLVVKATFFPTAQAQQVRRLLAEGVVTEFSFAYDVKEQRPGKDGVNELVRLHILEAGPCLKGANSATRLIGVRSYDRATGTHTAKAEPGDLAEGSFVQWAGGYGRVEYIMTEGEFGVEGDPLSLEATAEDPLALVREYDEEGGEWLPTDNFTAHRFSELVAVEPKHAPRVETSAHVGTAVKSGRVLSTKNEGRIREAVGLLDEVLGTLTADDNAKSEEPEVKDEQAESPANTGMDAATAQLLLELETAE